MIRSRIHAELRALRRTASPAVLQAERAAIPSSRVAGPPSPPRRGAEGSKHGSFLPFQGRDLWISLLPAGLDAQQHNTAAGMSLHAGSSAGCLHSPSSLASSTLASAPMRSCTQSTAPQILLLNPSRVSSPWQWHHCAVMPQACTLTSLRLLMLFMLPQPLLQHLYNIRLELLSSSFMLFFARQPRSSASN